MKKLIASLLVVPAMMFGAHYVLTVICVQRFQDHVNQCHAELHVGEKLHAAVTDRDVDAVLVAYGACAKDKSNTLDRLFERRRIDESMEIIKSMNRKS